MNSQLLLAFDYAIGISSAIRKSVHFNITWFDTAHAGSFWRSLN